MSALLSYTVNRFLQNHYFPDCVSETCTINHPLKQIQDEGQNQEMECCCDLVVGHASR